MCMRERRNNAHEADDGWVPVVRGTIEGSAKSNTLQLSQHSALRSSQHSASRTAEGRNTDSEIVGDRDSKKSSRWAMRCTIQETKEISRSYFCSKECDGRAQNPSFDVIYSDFPAPTTRKHDGLNRRVEEATREKRKGSSSMKSRI